jgi:hypothetical protein
MSVNSDIVMMVAMVWAVQSAASTSPEILRILCIEVFLFIDFSVARKINLLYFKLICFPSKFARKLIYPCGEMKLKGLTRDIQIYFLL